MRVRSEISGLPGAVEITASAGPGFINTTAPLISYMWAAIVFKRKDRAIIEENSPMAGAAGTLAVNARQYYHNRRTNSAAIGV